MQHFKSLSLSFLDMEQMVSITKHFGIKRYRSVISFDKTANLYRRADSGTRLDAGWVSQIPAHFLVST